MSAGGSAAVVVTITHRRAYAAKKGALASVCASVIGPPDIKDIKSKNPLELSSVRGGHKNLICPGPGKGQCSDTPDNNDPSDFFARRTDLSFPKVQEDASDKNTRSYTKVKYWHHDLNKGCGTLEETLDKSYAYRLYEKGYCPVVLENGTLKYKVATYYEGQECGKDNLTECPDYNPTDPPGTWEKNGDNKWVKFTPRTCGPSTP